ncbi:Chromosome partition protein Smc [Rhodovastum atsumiense]|uniref:chromosome segregation SMC family protein n=1 Tax=Rhodovastum atsumiense TaxID=504468 RepID=UPI001EF08C68|nr:AAA family ATPase [Rhodovastum atsumiense]CAH2600135.1 Chromosome partition protein Smc [Rhodovastum atsumiense]
MPVSFSRLRIAGFKSFAEPVVVDLLPGLTGIVGPNGCGKSNVVEALRWAMGENSARSLRGGEMDDVIFAGTAHRPSRNIAEVTLQLTETQGAAPPPFHEAPELEISRRIERGAGSLYRVNGREARARDVQTLFADLATGARSSGMISQGRVGTIVNARPDDRRAILEEAAGITGLHARRHEAELKLRAAEANLARAEDLRGQLEGQLDGLKRQARQANRYRAISGLIRTAEAELLAIQRAKVETARAAAQRALHAAGTAVAEATTEATTATEAATAAAAALPPLRETEGEARTALERHRLAGEQIAAEEARAQEALQAATARLEQVTRDLAHAGQVKQDAAAALDRLAAELARIEAEDAAHPAHMDRAEAAAAEAAEAARAADAAATRATEHAADLAARHRALSEALAAAETRMRRLTEQQSRLAAERAEVTAQLVDPAALQATEAEREAAEAALADARATLEQAEQARAAALQEAARSRAAAAEEAQRLRATGTETAAKLRRAAQEDAAKLRADSRERALRLRTEAQAALAAAREAATTAESARAKLAAEAQALAEVLSARDGERWPRMVDQLTVPAGLEAALGAALGEELDSAANTDAARHWRELPPLDPMPPLPDGVPSLAGLVQAPAALARALSQIGLVEDGGAAQPRLLPGQVLVSRAGAVWRWDGYVIQAGTPTPAAIRLQQRNRLAELRTRLAAATEQAEAARAARTEAEAAERAARAEADSIERAAQAEAESRERGARAEAEAAERAARESAERLERESRAAAEAAERSANAAEQQARTARRDTEQRLERARAAASALATRAANAEARRAALDSQDARLAAEAAEAEAGLRDARAAMAGLDDPAAARTAMDQARDALATARARESETREARDALGRAAGGRAHRRRTLEAERGDWTMRAQDAEGRLIDLTARANEVRAEHAALQAAPAEIAVRRAAALQALEAAQATHRQAADVLHRAEQEASAADRHARAAEAALAAAREHVVRAEGDATAADQAWGVVAERILERLGDNPTLPDPPAEIGPDTEDKARRKLERLQREREEMGPVNLRAEVEAEEIGKQIDTIAREREELTTAIAKLRGSIGHLNREGRERLSQVFAEVDQHFQALFTRMFGGGRAHLALVGSDDPLEAGLEIYAQPPGKKLATLSLLSGGEQALTALSLIFAVFRCNPAPVCVLDEVDAPLDEANVERFCTLLEDMVRETGTRFLVVTHHHVTMARMDRLYGVTMQERGVSRVLSVDLQRASEMVDPPRMAAE